MTVVNIEFRANANFADLTAQVNRANAAVAGLNKNLAAVNAEKLGAAFNNFNNAMTAGGKFTATTTQVISNTEKFGKALASQRLTLSEYNRSMVDFIRNRDTQIKTLARQQVAMERSMVMTQGTAAGGAARATVFTPTSLSNDLATRTALANKEIQIFNKVLNDGATSLINWGKNTQWAGRQLTVGLTMPIMILGTLAAVAFKNADKELVRMIKVYGDSTTNLTQQQTQLIRKSAMDLGKELASSWGAALDQTLGLAADFAAVGKQGNDLIESTRQTTRLMVLGEVDRQTAMKTTLSIQSAFHQDTKGLAESINFLNAVENQTSATLDDLTVAIPKAGPVVRALGGDIKDLALMFVAMKEGGVPAAEAANAIKSGLASIINPTLKTQDFFKSYGIDVKKIVDDNEGKLIPTLTSLKEALDSLDPLARARAIEMMFGKFQFARISTMFDNLGRAGSQTQKVMELAGSSTMQLAQIADRELTTMTESASGKFQRATETIKANMAGLGESMLPVLTGILNAVNWIIEKFNSMPDFVKNFIGFGLAMVAVAGPAIMITGVMANLLGYMVKFFAVLRNIRHSGLGAFENLTPEVMAAKYAGDQLKIGFENAALATDRMAGSIKALIKSLMDLQAAQTAVATKSSVAVAAQTAAGRRYISAAASSSAVASEAVATHGGLSFLPIPLANEKRWNKAKTKQTDRGTSFTGLTRSHLYPVTKFDQSRFTESEIMNAGVLSSITQGKGSLGARANRNLGSRMIASSIFELNNSSQNPDEWREQRLRAMGAYSAPGRAGYISQPLPAGEMRRLLPQAEDFKAVQLRYLVSLRAVADKGKDAFMAMAAQLSKVNAETNPEQYAAILQRAAADVGLTEKQAVVQAEELYKQLQNTFNKAYAASKESLGHVKRVEIAMKAAMTEALAMETAITRPYSGVRGSGFSTSKDTKSIDLRGAMVASMQIERESQLATGARTAATQQSTASLQESTTSTESVTIGNKKYTLLLNANGEVVEASTRGLNNVVAVTRAGTTGMEILIKALNAQQVAAERAAAAEAALWTPLNQLKEGTAALALARERAAAMTLGGGQAAPVGFGRLAGPFGGIFNTKGLGNIPTPIMGGPYSDIKDKPRQKLSGGRLGGAMGAGMLLSMIPMMLPETGNASLDTGKNILSGAGMGASMGMMAGGWGMAAGAIIGTAIPAVSALINKLGEAERTYKSLTSVGEVGANQFGLAIKTLADTQLNSLIGKSQEAKTAVDQLASAFSQAAEGSQDKNFIDSLKGADDNAITGYIRDKVVTLVAAGAKPDEIRTYIAGALKAAGQEKYTLAVTAKLDSFELEKGAAKVINDKINDEAQKIKAGPDYKNISDTLNSYITTAQGQAMGKTGLTLTKEQILDTSMSAEVLAEKYGTTVDVIEHAREEFKLLGEQTRGAAEALTTVATSMPIDQFMKLVPTLDTVNISTQDLIAGATQIPGVGEAISNALLRLQEQGGSTKNMLEGIALVNAGVISSWTELAHLPVAELEVKYVEHGLATGLGKALIDSHNARQKKAKGAVDPEKLKEQQAAENEAAQEAIDRMREAEQARQDAFGARKDLVEEYYNKQIDKIKELEDVRQKAFDKEQKRLAREKEQRQMQIGYREALASGNFGQAALIQNNMENARKQYAVEDSAEAAKSATEKRISAIEKERDAKVKSIEAAQEADKKASDAAIKSAEKALKAKEKADKAALKSAENSVSGRKKAEDGYSAKVQEAVDRAKTDFDGGMTDLIRIAQRGGPKVTAEVVKAFDEAFGKGSGALIYGKISENLKDAPWDLLSQLATAKMNNNQKAAAAILIKIGKWNPTPDTTSDPTPRRPRLASGGQVNGPGGPREDKIPAWLSNGEFVMQASSVDKYGLALMHAINSGKFASGGLVGNVVGGTSKAVIWALASQIAGGTLGTTPGAGGGGPDPLPDKNMSTNRLIGKRLAGAKGWGSGSQWNALDFIFQHESGWSTTSYDSAQRNSDGSLKRDPVDPRAYLTWGIPQANPAHKMASAGADWVTNPSTQIRWGLGYISGTYGNPLNAYNRGMSRGSSGRNDGWGWYADGGLVGIPSKSTFKKISILGKKAWLVNALTKRLNAKTASVPADPGTDGGTVVAPVSTRTVMNGTRYNRGGEHAEGWLGQPNSGVNDIDASVGTAFRALVGGNVIHSGQGYYYPPGYVVVKSGNTEIRYGHALTLADEGDHVNAGDVVGKAATTNEIPTRGRSMTTPHLHFAWRNNSKLIQRQSGYVPWLDDTGKLIKMRDGGLIHAQIGEYVVNRAATKKYGGLIDAMNNQTYHSGGLVTDTGPRLGALASDSSAVYNNKYEFNIDARGTDLSEQQIASLAIRAFDARESRKGARRT